METLRFDIYSLAALVFHCGFMILYLFSVRQERRDHLILLGCAFTMLLGWYLSTFFQETGIFAAYPAIIGWPTIFIPLLAPSLYFYVVALSSQKPWERREQSRWHLYIAVFIVLLEVPFAISSGDVKLLKIHDFHARPEGIIGLWFWMSWLSNVLLLIQLGVYILLALRRLLHHAVRIQHLFSNLENRTLLWLRNYLILMCTLWLMGLIEFVDLPSDYSWIIHIAWMMTFSLLAVRQKPVFELNVPAEQEVEETTAEPDAKPSKSSLSEDRRKRVADKLRHAMEQEHLYRDADLTLRKLSDKIGVSTHHISETLRDEIGQNFYDFINNCRIKEACNLLTATEDATIDIAFAVGFNSRSTFSAAFKKHEGTSPAAYRKSAA